MRYLYSLRSMFTFLIASGLVFSVSADAQDFSDPAVQKAEAAKVEKYSLLFADNADQVSDLMAYECTLFMNLTLRSALNRYGSDPRMTDRAMMTLNTTNAGWKTLWERRKSLGRGVEEGALHNAIASGDVGYVRANLGVLQSKCNSTFDRIVFAAERPQK